MKYTVITCLACISSLLVTCKKHDYCPEPPKRDSTCELVQSFEGRFAQYRKEFDGSGSLIKVVAGLYTLGLYDSVTMLVQYKGSTIYLFDQQNPTDTFSTVTFDAQHRLEKMTAGNAKTKWGYNPFFTSQFFYEAGRLSYYLIGDQFNFHLSYDVNGNVTRIYLESDSTNKGIFFTYDLSVTATHQFYSDHFSIYGVCDAVNLAQFMGWLADLNPINKRTSFIYVADQAPTATEPGYIGKHPITGHVFDSNGNLASYNSLVWDNDIMFKNVYRCAANGKLMGF